MIAVSFLDLPSCDCSIIRALGETSSVDAFMGSCNLEGACGSGGAINARLGRVVQRIHPFAGATL